MIKSVIINNFGPLENVQFDCKKFNIFQGKNNQGKTSILEAIKWCIIGGNDEFLVRNGTSTCEVILVSDKGSRIERRLTRGGTSKLYIYGADEKPVKEPQNALNKLYNPLLFGPTDMLRMKAKDLNEFISTTISKRLKLSDKEIEEYGLKDEVNLNEDPVREIQKFYDELFKERTEVNRAVKNFESKSSGAELVKQVTDIELEAMEKLVAQTEADLSSAKEKNIRLDISRKNADIKFRTEANIKLLKKELEDGMVVLEQLDESAKELTTLVTEKERLEKELDKDRTELANIKATLDKLGTGEIACPINALIKCTTDMKPYKEQLEKAQDKIKTAGKAKYAKTTELNERIINIRSAIETGKNLKSKKLELDRAESILSELEILDGDIVDVTGLETSLKQMKDELYKARLSKDINKISGIDSMRKRQDELNKQLEKLNVLLKEVIPSRLTLGVKDVTLGKEGIFYQGLPLVRIADSLKLRLCTAILKDLFPQSNLYCLDKLETIHNIELKKYIEYYSNEKNEIQYMGSLVGEIGQMNSSNVKIITMDNFKIKT